MAKINFGAFLLVLAVFGLWWIAQSPTKSNPPDKADPSTKIQKDAGKLSPQNYSKFTYHQLAINESFESKNIKKKSDELALKLGGFNADKYLSLARQGNDDVLLDLCRRYSNGWGIDKNYEKAYKIAVESTSTSWKSRLIQAFHLLKGLGVEADIERAEKIYWVILDKPDVTAKAHLWLADLLYAKSKVDISRKADLLKVLESGCNKGFADCLRFRAAISLENAQTAEAKLKAKSEYEHASATGDKDVAFEFASLRLEGIFGDADVKDGYLAMKELAQEGCEVAMRRVGIHLMKVGDNQGVDWLEKARLSGDTMAEECLTLARKSVGLRN